MIVDDVGDVQRNAPRVWKKIHVVDVKHKTQTQDTKHTVEHMLQSFPAYVMHSAMQFQDFGYCPPEPVTRDSSHGESTEEEDYVLV